MLCILSLNSRRLSLAELGPQKNPVLVPSGGQGQFWQQHNPCVHRTAWGRQGSPEPDINVKDLESSTYFQYSNGSELEVLVSSRSLSMWTQWRTGWKHPALPVAAQVKPPRTAPMPPSGTPVAGSCETGNPQG